MGPSSPLSHDRRRGPDSSRGPRTLSGTPRPNAQVHHTTDAAASPARASVDRPPAKPRAQDQRTRENLSLHKSQRGRRKRESQGEGEERAKRRRRRRKQREEPFSPLRVSVLYRAGLRPSLRPSPRPLRTPLVPCPPQEGDARTFTGTSSTPAAGKKGGKTRVPL